MFLTIGLFVNDMTKPAPRSTKARTTVLIQKPVAAMIQAITVVPMFAPIITLIPCCSDRVATPTRLATMIVVALEDWTTAVMPTPDKICFRGDLEVIHFSNLLSRSPQDF